MPTEPAPAKINLTLHVTGRRPDGYHLLDSLVVFAGARDIVSAEPATGLSLTIGGPFAPALSVEPDNLVLRAARALADAGGIRADAALHLDKHLPVASGIGGGSSDAAAALRVLARLWSLDLPHAALLALAQRLGADVPVCLDPRPRCMAGIGEILSPAPTIPSCGIVLVNPGRAVATQAVFRARTGTFTSAPKLPDAWPDAAAMAAGLAASANDLQASAVLVCPSIGEVLTALSAAPGCLLARMSGSGATCFGLFASADLAEQAAIALARPGWWSWGGPLYDAASGT
jgi:4-diphosphocytidyl-2-C-methyl-D-erythritol kinase